MPQSLNQKAVNNFVRGLITEAGELTFPEGASVDELNCELRRDGSRRRRLGVAYEASNVLTDFSLLDSELVCIGEWKNVGGNADLEFLVLQRGRWLHFYNKGDTPFSAQIELNAIDLSAYEHAGSAGAQNAKCQFTSVKGFLIVSSPNINTIAVEYDSVTATFARTQISFKTRDFDFQGDTEDYFTEGTGTIPDSRKYDTLNSGWGDPNTGRSQTALDYYTSTQSSKYPALTHPWFSGKNTSNQFDVTEWKKIGAGTSLSGAGRYILDFFNKNRNDAALDDGISISINNEIESSRFRCVESFAGRVFYAGLDSAKNAGTILFSKLIDTTSDLGKCHQVNDPTSEYLSDLLATDGGEIKIPDAVKIQKLYGYQNSLYVFAENGIWQITGVDGVFRATEYSINRVSRIGILNPETFVAAEGVPFWWSSFGIHTLSADPVSGQGQEQNLTLPTIQTLWDNIDPEVKLKVVSTYDSINKRIYWGYPDANETVEAKLNNFLILDIPLQAFYPWKVSDQASNTDCIVGLAFYTGFGASTNLLDVTSDSGSDDVGEHTLTSATAATYKSVAGSAEGTLEITDASHTLSVSDSVRVDFEAIYAFGSLLGLDTSSIEKNLTVSATTATTFSVPVTYTTVQQTTGQATLTSTFYYSNLQTATVANDIVSSQISSVPTGSPQIVLICRDSTDNKITFGGFLSTSFLDWADTNYTSFAETGYDFMGDAVTKKNAPYLISYCRLTEEGFTGSDSDGYEAIRPSGLKVSAAWDFKDTFGTSQQIYRQKYPVVVNPSDLTDFAYPEDMITSRVKIRGHGRSMRLKYESEQGKDFILVGWGMIQGRNPRY